MGNNHSPNNKKSFRVYDGVLLSSVSQNLRDFPTSYASI